MNERIKELIEQAYDPEYGFIIPEKFAELIVRECIQYLTDEAERLYSLRNDDGDLCAAKCYDNIEGLKEHFGVE